MTFRVGQKVVCVDTWPRGNLRLMWDKFWHPYKSPVKGEIYTICGIFTDETGNLHLELIELPNRDDYWLDGFYACGFRPLIERKTDISVFTKMLTDTKIPALTASKGNRQ